MGSSPHGPRAVTGLGLEHENAPMIDFLGPALKKIAFYREAQTPQKSVSEKEGEFHMGGLSDWILYLATALIVAVVVVWCFQ